MSERHWEHVIQGGFYGGDGVELTVTPTGVEFSVTAEQAVDSYNQTFTCSVIVPFDKLGDAVRLLQTAAAQGAP